MLTGYKVDIDFKKLESELGDFKTKMNSIARRMMGAVASEIKKDTKATKLKGQILQKRSGNLQKKLKFKTYKDFTATVSNNAFYASWHENGNGKLPARPFLLPTIDDYFGTNKAENVMDKIMQDALDKIFSKEQ